MGKTKKQSFVIGALILGAAGICVKVIGALFKIPLGNFLGPEGMANFTIAYNIYALLFVLSTAGVPVAISKMVAEACVLGRHKEVDRIYKVSMLAFVLIGTGGFALLYFGADYFANLMGNADSALAIKAIAPAILFVSISSICRGYYQGYSNMTPTAVSQIIEALGKLIIGLSAAWFLLNSGFGEQAAAAGAIAGVTVGALASALYFLFKRRERLNVNNSYSRSRRQIFKELLCLSIPITLGAAVISLSNVIDSAMLMNLLQNTGFTFEEAKWLYGSYTYSANLFNLPSVIATTIAVTLIPAISAAYIKKEMQSVRDTVESAIRITMLVALPCAAGLYALAIQITDLLYGYGVESAAIKASGDMLRTLALAVPFLALVSLTNAILQAIGKVNLPIISIVAGVTVKLLANYILVGNPHFNIYGAPIGTVLCYVAIAIMNLLFIKYTGGIVPKFQRVILKPAIAAVAAGLAANIAYIFIMPVIGTKIGTIFSIVTAGLVWLILIIITKTLTETDLSLLPKGDKIAKFIKKD